MAMIGIRELREKTTEVLRKVSEEKAEYVITNQGHPVALLLPIDAQAVETAMLEAGKQSATNGWELYSRLADVLRQTWPSGKDTQALMDELRRE
jgi:prevent-host-death family protein